MSNRERRRRARARARIFKAVLTLAVAFVVIGVGCSAGKVPETSAKPLAEEAETCYIFPLTERDKLDDLPTIAPPPETAEEPEEPKEPPEPEEPEPVSRYAGLEISEDDVYLLACLVYHEARGECFEGQVAVVEVVFNRMLSDRFPDTAEEVVFQKYGKVWQFSPAPYIWTAEPGETQYRAVYTAMSETEYNVTETTVYFSTATYNDKISAIIGHHYFCEL